jgi:hypothetical protein
MNKFYKTEGKMEGSMGAKAMKTQRLFTLTEQINR